MSLYITVTDATGAAEPDVAASLRRDLDSHVASAGYVTAGEDPAAKGDLLLASTLVISALSAPSVVALVGVIKAYLSRDKTLKIKLKTPLGEAELSSANPTLQTHAQIEELIGRLMPQSSSQTP